MRYRYHTVAASIVVAILLIANFTSSEAAGQTTDRYDTRYAPPAYVPPAYVPPNRVAPNNVPPANQPPAYVPPAAGPTRTPQVNHWPATPAPARQYENPQRYPYAPLQNPPPQNQVPYVAQRQGPPQPQQYPQPQPNYSPLTPRYPTPQDTTMSGHQKPIEVEMVLLKNAVIIARVGEEAITAGDCSAGWKEIYEKNKDRIPEDQIETQYRYYLIAKLLGKLPGQDKPGGFGKIDMLLVYIDARRTIPEEALPNVEESLAKQFEQAGLKDMMERAKVETRHELEQKLEELGTSLEREKRNYMQTILAMQWLNEQTKGDEEITHGQMLDWYNEHISEYEYPAKAKWEELMVSFSKYRDKAEARAAIARMGNQVLNGVPLAQVAAQGSNGFTADKGGRRDWTTKGSLSCEALDKALFGLPVGQLSQIIESSRGLHIIRVTERKPAGVTSFVEAQAEIRPMIRKERIMKKREDYLAKLREEIPVWTLFDAEIAEMKAKYETAQGETPSRY